MSDMSERKPVDPANIAESLSLQAQGALSQLEERLLREPDPTKQSSLRLEGMRVALHDLDMRDGQDGLIDSKLIAKYLQEFALLLGTRPEKLEKELLEGKMEVPVNTMMRRFEAHMNELFQKPDQLLPAPLDGSSYIKPAGPVEITSPAPTPSVANTTTHMR